MQTKYIPPHKRRSNSSDENASSEYPKFKTVNYRPYKIARGSQFNTRSPSITMPSHIIAPITIPELTIPTIVTRDQTIVITDDDRQHFIIEFIGS